MRHPNLKKILKVGLTLIFIELLIVFYSNKIYRLGQLDGCTRAVAGIVPIPTTVYCYVDENNMLLASDTEGKIKTPILLDTNVKK